MNQGKKKSTIRMHFFQSLNISFGSGRLDRRNVQLGQIRNQVVAGDVTGTERNKKQQFRARGSSELKGILP